jgi:DNA repair photolyase
VDIRVNCVERLDRALTLRQPCSVLLGSTTECFQPVEERVGLTGAILELLNARRVRYTILTRSPLILRAVDILKGGFCDQVYFTFNAMSAAFKAALEPLSPDFSERMRAMKILQETGVPVVPYLSPFLPWITDVAGALADAPGGVVEGEGLNFRLANIQQIITAIRGVSPSVGARYQKMLTDRRFYEIVWRDTRSAVTEQAARHKKRLTVYQHAFGQYFSQSYQPRQDTG